MYTCFTCICLIHIMGYREVFMSGIFLDNKGCDFFFINFQFYKNSKLVGGWWVGFFFFHKLCGPSLYLFWFTIVHIFHYMLGETLYLANQIQRISSPLTSRRNVMVNFPFFPSSLLSLPTNTGLSNSKQSKNDLEIIFLLIYPVFFANSFSSFTY